MRNRLVPALAAIVATLAIAACGSSSSSGTTSTAGYSKSASAPTSTAATSSGSGAPAATTSTTTSTAAAGASAPQSVLSLSANSGGALMFSTNALTAKAGKVTIHFTNHAPEAHDLSVQVGTSGTVLGATGAFTGGTRTLTLTLKAGMYTFFCNVPGHRAAGMHGTLTVVA